MELKPCPFCGYEKPSLSSAHTNFFEEVFFVICDNCRCRGKQTKSKDEAVKVWNRRADDGT